MLMIPADGAARFHGSEEALAEALVNAVAEFAGCECSVGAADGLLAAILAARFAELVPAGESAAFLAPRPIEDLTLRPWSAPSETRRRPGIRADAARHRHPWGCSRHCLSPTFWRGLAPLAPGRIASRGARTWRRPCCGEPRRTSGSSTSLRTPPRTHRAAHSRCAPLAERLDAALLAAGARCGKVRIAARTERGESLERVWRTDVGASAGAFASHMADRVRWQLEGWLSGTVRRPRARCGNRRPCFARRDRGRRGAARRRAVVPMGRHLRRRLARAARHGAGAGTAGARRRARRSRTRWPHPRASVFMRSRGVKRRRSPRAQRTRGPAASPIPPPRRCSPRPLEIHVLDAGGTPVTRRPQPRHERPTHVGAAAGRSSRRAGARRATGTRLPGHVGRRRGAGMGRPRPVEAWAGPWPIVERWWSADGSRRAFLQVALRAADDAAGPALLIAFARALDARGRL